MASTKAPTTNAAETSTGLVNPTNAYADDGSYATAAPGKNLTLATKYGTFGFDALLPSNATISNVKLEYQWKCSTTSSVATARTYYKISGVAGANNDDATEPAGDTIRTYDVTAARSWTRADLLDGVFEIVLAAVQGSSSTAVTFSFDYVAAIVTWSATTTKTETGVANISANTTKTETGVAKITATTTKTETGVARVTVSTTKTETGLSRIQTTVSQTVTGVSKIARRPQMLNNYLQGSADSGMSMTEKIIF